MWDTKEGKEKGDETEQEQCEYKGNRGQEEKNIKKEDIRKEEEGKQEKD